MNWLKKTWKKQGDVGKAMMVVIGIIAICCLCSFPFALIIGISGDSTTKTAPTAIVATSALTVVSKPSEIPQPTKSTEIVTTLEPHAALEDEIKRILGDGNRNVPPLTTLNFDDPEKGAIFINWAINDNLTENLIKFGAKKDATEILHALAKSGIDYTYVILSGSFPMADQFGNSEEKNVVNLTFYKTTAEKINWDGFLSDNIYKIADEAHIWVQFQD